MAKSNFILIGNHYLMPKRDNEIVILIIGTFHCRLHNVIGRNMHIKRIYCEQEDDFLPICVLNILSTCFWSGANRLLLKVEFLNENQFQDQNNSVLVKTGVVISAHNFVS